MRSVGITMEAHRPEAQEGAGGISQNDDPGDSMLSFSALTDSRRRSDQSKNSLTLWLSSRLRMARGSCHEIADKLLGGELFGHPPCGSTLRSLILQLQHDNRAKLLKFFTDLDIDADIAERIILGPGDSPRPKRPRMQAFVDEHTDQ